MSIPQLKIDLRAKLLKGEEISKEDLKHVIAYQISLREEALKKQDFATKTIQIDPSKGLENLAIQINQSHQTPKKPKRQGSSSALKEFLRDF